MAKTRRDHYLPQFYLRHFSQDPKRVWAFVKARGCAFHSAIRDVGQKPGYYKDIRLEPWWEGDTFEESLHKFEDALAVALDNTIDAAQSLPAVPRELKGLVAVLAAYLNLAHPRTRSTCIEDKTLFWNEAKDRLMARCAPGVDPAGYPVSLEDGQEAQCHAEFIQERLPLLFGELSRGIWVFYLNKTRHPFYTSDAPVALVYRPSAPEGHGARAGIEVVLPLSSRVLLTALEPDHFSALRPFDLLVLEMDEAKVALYNELQGRWATERIFCESNDFEVAGRPTSDADICA